MEFRLLHFTDIHLTAAPAEIPWRSLLGKRFVGWINLRFLGRHHHLIDASRITQAFVDDIEGVSPDHLLFTGDATGLSLESEFEDARRILGPLIETGRITGIPGNHDVYSRAAVRERLYETHLGSWEASDGPSPPILRLLGDHLALICLKDSRPTAAHDSSGRIGDEQLGRLEELLHDSRVRDRVRVVALHYGPLRADGKPDAFLHGLRDWQPFLEIVDRAGVDLVVHGHLHRRFFLPKTSGRNVPITTPGSLTYQSCDRAYHVYHIGKGGVSIEVRRYDETTNKFAPWPNAPGAGRLASR